MRFTYVFREKYQVFPVKKMKVLETRLQKGFAMGLSPALAVQGEFLNLLSQSEGHCGCLIEGFVQEQILVRAATLNAAVGEESLWNAEFPSACSQEYWE